MKKLFPVIFALLSIAFLIYLLPPSPEFPSPLPGSFQSSEPGDSEDLSVKRAYFTDFTREEVINLYQEEFSKNLFTPSIRLNYPPEDAQTLIRDQTRSTFLEEIVHPFRESFFINGFEPSDPKDDVWYKGVDYRQKITVRYSRTSTPTRLVIGVATIGFTWIISKAIIWEVGKLWKSR